MKTMTETGMMTETPNDGSVRVGREAGELLRRLEEMAERQARMETLLVRLSTGKQLDLLTTEDVRRILGIGRTKLAELIASGELRMWKLGGERRITRAGLEAYIRRLASR